MTELPAGPDLRIALLFPTDTEAEPFLSGPLASDESLIPVITGVGLTAAAHATTRTIVEHDPDLLVMVGVAGVYPHVRGIGIGDVVLVSSEIESDLGSFTPNGFGHISTWGVAMDFARRGAIECPHIPADAPFPAARSASVNAAMAPFIDASELEIENMEGAAFYYVCLREGKPFLQLRAVSNVVGPEEPWDVSGSVTAMAEGLTALLAHLRNR